MTPEELKPIVMAWGGPEKIANLLWQDGCVATIAAAA
jgi:hypothetical protein